MKRCIVLVLVTFAVGALFASGCVQVPTKFAAYPAADSLQKDGKFAEAIEKYNEFVETNPESALVPNALFHIAECYVGLDQKDDATAAFKKVMDQFPASDPAQWAKQKIKILED